MWTSPTLENIVMKHVKEIVMERKQVMDDRASKKDMVGQYVIVRCKDAGVHAGYLEWRKGRSCRLRNSRRLWYWKPKNGAAFLSGVAIEGLDDESKVGAPIDLILTENCEIILTTKKARKSIKSMPDFIPK